MITQTYLKKSLLLLACTLILFSSCNKRSGDPKVLVFSKTAGFHHESIASGIAAIQKLGAENGFAVDTTTNSDNFNEENLSQYSTVIWLSTTGEVLNHYQEADFERYIQAGGGFVGVHAATDTEYHWGWYNRLVGAYFLDHPGINDPHPNVQDGTINVTDRSHSTTKFLPEIWNRKDEWYSFKKLNPEVNVLMNLDESSYQGGVKMGEHPVAWYHEYDGGRAFYTAGGHTNESYTEDLFLQHLLAGIQYAIGDNKKLDYSKAKTQRIPEENRFEKTDLVKGVFTEPTEMTVLPNLDILIAQRRGEVMFYKSGDSTANEIAKLDVYWKTETPGVNAEEGLMGIQKDPNYAKNGHVFVFYSPIDKEVNRLSRFTFKNDTWDMASEKIVLEFYSQRNICCHTGGSIAFDKDGLLYVSTGDNSTPFDEAGQKFQTKGYAPVDGRPGHEQFDARRSSGNSNDLRGKILRIKVKEDGTYEIPEGNLYPKGTEGTRPEIYVQGNRNPYRISIDQKNGFLYWGEVGPDANMDSLDNRGPRGYDEVNQARKAGNFGWPYFVGDNYGYFDYDYETGTSTKAFDPAKPVNTSLNNTGIKDLPKAEPAFIWYPYGASEEFPQLGTGGRNAMAGPVYYTDMFPKETRYPDYYNGKFFMYDWIRGWIKVVTMQPNGDFDKMDPFMSTTKFNALMDMEVGSDGKIYVLEYGNGWFTKNADSGLSRIDFNDGNRTPVVQKITVDKTSGALPFTAVFKVDASDPENDPLTFVWDLGNGETVTTSEPELKHTFNALGDYDVQVQVSDPGKLSAKSNLVSVYAGNIAPIVNIQVEGNQTFYFANKPVSYTITVTDPDDAEVGKDLSSLFVSADYISGVDMAEASQGHLIMTEAMTGKSLMGSLTCKTCHKDDEASIGPSFTEVARKYRRNPNAVDYLVNKIQKGGGGIWGETVMPANPELKNDDGRKIAAYILSLGRRGETLPSLPAKGTVKPTLDKAPSDNGVLILSASFTDRGGENIKPLTGNSSLGLRNSKMGMDQASKMEGYSAMSYNGQTLLLVPAQEAHFGLPAMDLTSVSSIDIIGGGQKPTEHGFVVELRLDTPDGKKIGESLFKVGGPGAGGFFGGMASIAIEPITDGKKHELFVVTRPANAQETGTAALMSVELKAK
ncbi:Crp/Fnr family transcriptional regulator [Rhodonellum psychrophilum GCM71 = DSM 17998]|uniref:Crp/Fnr family transcriptional regulator n=2 Tax=Rhodonellum TaxID=336827 RepID=U5BRH3_9BACT|nr:MULTISPECIES: ThuA domain-containing protein [Rhodonellum]ERM83185.1 Crp/Fnr family transcriptional regulator [Rhodonellum psychrophilum GCM71 = DSM 17998]SDZ14673.1 Glucose/arabinose dehydrogenase, beta-propeller fold [Rhodonellum ikkaensis]